MKQLRIAFFCENCLPFHGNTLQERPLGGTETGIIRLTEALCELGHEIEVFTRHDSLKDAQTTLEVSSEKKPFYRPVEAIHEAKRFDVLVLVKDFRPARFALPANKVFLLTGDGPEQYVTYGIGDRRMAAAIDQLLCVSQWQADVLCEASGFPRSKVAVIGNGVHLPFFSGREEREPLRLIYASSPNRGLHPAHIAFQLLQKILPAVTLHVFSDFAVYDDRQKFSGPLVDQFHALQAQMSKNPAIIFHGNITQERLARELMKSTILFYPNQFVETSCIVALEAQTAGCIVLASSTGGLVETVSDRGILVNKPVGTKEYFIAFAEEAHKLLTDSTLRHTLSERSRTYMHREGGWIKVAKRFLSNCW